MGIGEQFEFERTGRIEPEASTIEGKFRRDWLKADNKDGVCMHCGKRAEDGSTVCDRCYSQYTPGMLADLEP